MIAMDDHIQDTRTSSPTLSSTSDSDAYNTADARIHFGPLRSPEKKFVSTITRRSTLHPHLVSSPLRRSPRLSTPRPRSSSPHGVEGSNSAEQSNNENIALSRSGTPENGLFLHDEPSSALANKIVRAHDNPSPPPRAPSPTFDIECPPSPSSVTFPWRNIVFPSNCQAATQSNIILSESDSTPPGTSRSINAPRPLPSPPHINDYRLVDNLCPPIPDLPPETTAGPSNSYVAETFEDVDIKEQNKINELIADVIDERAVAETLSLDSKVHFTDRPGPTHLSVHPSTPQTDLVEDMCEHTTNPHRSNSPHPSTRDPGVDETIAPASLSDSPRQIRKASSYGKQRDLSYIGNIIDDSRSGEGKDHGDLLLSSTRERPDEAAGEAKRKGDLGHSSQENRTTGPTYRELGSLSPTSTSLLTELVPSPTSLLPIVEPNSQDHQGESSINIESIPVFPSVPQIQIISTPTRTIGPIRFSSPIRSGNQSPAKVRLQPVALNDPNRTPARRVFIEEAITQGRSSTQKTGRPMGLSNLKVEAARTPIFNISSTDSPARRVGASGSRTPSGQNRSRGMRFGSPTRAPSSSSREAQKTEALNGKALDPRHTDTSAPKPGPTGTTLPLPFVTVKPVALPFPIVASLPDSFQSIPEDRTAAEIKAKDFIKPPQSSPMKSNLKHMTSRIPRVVKPYARPVMKIKERAKSTDMRPTGLLNDDHAVNPALTEPPDYADIRREGSSTNPGLSLTTLTTTTPTLKRKRTSVKDSPLNKPRPVVLLRQVPKMTGHTSISLGVIRSNKFLQPSNIGQPSSVTAGSVLDAEPIERDDNPEVKPKSPEPPPSPNVREKSPEPNIVQPPDSGARRRTSRVRKTVNPTVGGDIFNSTEVRPSQPRRKVAVRHSDDAFSGMTAVALKALTCSNTIKNQRYLAAKLETKVIRKEGSRPESPAVKVRTISQRYQDEKSKQRKERAARRARRGDGTPIDQSETEGRSDVGDSSGLDFDSDWENNSPVNDRHKRGPGDEEEYETPERLGRQPKKPRHVYAGGEETRRVKWDRGLFTTIYLDEVKVGTRPQPKDNAATKGCLALAAKTLPLDNLGNLPDADSPLSELVEENVVVKKFVYDSDVEPPPPVVVVKNTRLRSKKGQS